MHQALGLAAGPAASAHPLRERAGGVRAAGARCGHSRLSLWQALPAALALALALSTGWSARSLL